MFWSDISRGEVKDAPASDGILDGGARSGFRRTARHDGSRRAVFGAYRRGCAEDASCRIADLGAGYREAGARDGAVPRITYEEAVDILQRKGNPAKRGDDFGADDETILSKEFDRPVIVHRYPAALKAFYMETDPARPDLALCMDVLAPEGYGEIIGGGQRIHQHEKLLARIREHHLPVEAFQWYLDLRRYGSVPHAGFGMGIERAVAWICGLEHVRETIPFPRMLYRLYP